MGHARTPTSILFVCLGNICRSPLMEGLARAYCADWPEAPRFDSAGLGDWHAGEAPDPRAIAVARQHGVDIAGLRARAVVAEDFANFGLILCADRDNLATLRRRAPRDGPAELALFLDWAGVRERGDVPDPYTGGIAEFEATFGRIALGAQGVVARLRRASVGAR